MFCLGIARNKKRREKKEEKAENKEIGSSAFAWQTGQRGNYFPSFIVSLSASIISKIKKGGGMKI